MKKAPALQTTKDYSKFELCQFNRDVKKKKFLKASMEKHGFIPAYPMHCTRSSGGRLQIKAGHHRFEVAQELGLPVVFVVSDDDATIHELEKATTAWTIRDYMESFAKCGVEAYARVKEYHEKTGVPIGLCVSMLGGESAGSSNMLPKFKYGSYRISESTHADDVADIVLFCKELGVKSNDSIFVQSVSRCMYVDEFSPEIFKRRAAANASLLKPCRSVADQMAVLETVYNANARSDNRVPLVFLASKAARSRSVGVKKSEKGG